MARRKKKDNGKIEVLLDGDYLAYSAGFAAQHTYRLLLNTPQGVNPGVDSVLVGVYDSADDLKAATAEQADKPGGGALTIWERTEVEPVENALHTVKLQINRLLERVKEKTGREPELKAFLTGTGNFREILATIKPYKGNRSPFHRPRLYREIREYMVDRWGAEVIHGQEADDEVCIRQTAAAREGRASVIVGIDKDLWQCPGLHYSTMKDAFAEVSPALGLRMFYRQVLTGDATDNIGGVYRCGEKKAAELITPDMTEAQMYAVCLAAYEASIEKYGAERCGYADAREALLENCQLLWMRREYGETFLEALEKRHGRGVEAAA